MAQKRSFIGKLLRGMALMVALIVAVCLFSGCDKESESASVDQTGTSAAAVCPEATEPATAIAEPDSVPSAAENASSKPIQQPTPANELYPAPDEDVPSIAVETLLPEQYEILIEPSMLDADSVEVIITTNIPGAIEVMASLSLVGQAPDNVWIGVDERVSIHNGHGSVILDGSELPIGDYEVEVFFHPNWGFQDDVSRSCGIDQSISTTAVVSIIGSRESAEDITERAKKRSWVMANVDAGYPWDASFWIAEFGNFQQLVMDRYNPNIMKAFYFESIDMTLLVNVLKGEIGTYFDGKEGL